MILGIGGVVLEENKSVLKKMMYFDNMITPTIIRILYYVNVVLAILSGIFMMFAGVISNSLVITIMGLVLIILSPFLVRVGYEVLIIQFKIYENLNKLVQSNNRLEDKVDTIIENN